MKYSSFIAASCSAIAVSRSSSFPVLKKDAPVSPFLPTETVGAIHFENFVGSFPDNEGARVRLRRSTLRPRSAQSELIGLTVLYTLSASG